jgi:stage V sporulation protein G
VNITEVRIKLMESSEDRLRAFCSITIDDCFVVRDLKIIDGTSGPFVAMPSRKLAGHCQRCGYKNHLRAHYCNQCGVKVRLDGDFVDSPQKLYADVAHPINSACREMIQDAVLEEFEAELSRSRQPGYRSRYDDDFGYEADHPSEESATKTEPSDASTPDSSLGDSGTAAIIDAAEEPGPGPPKYREHETREGDQVNSSNRSGDIDDSFGAGIFDG